MIAHAIPTIHIEYTTGSGRLDSWEIEYRRKTPTSQRLFQRSAELHVNGVSHNIRYFDPYPFVTRSARGSQLVDVDGNGYTDYWMGHWSLILGHHHPDVEDALRHQISQGWMYGTLNEQALALSEAISSAIPAAERIRYVASGTEAAMYAVRLARAATGRRIIAKVEGGWHGYASDLLKTVNWPFDQPESTGTLPNDHIISIPYNDLPTSTQILDRYGSSLAGVLIEPLLGGGGGIPADADYLRGIRERVHHHGGLFMLDEIVTGFRLDYGCMHMRMGLEPDMVLLGKVVGGGMPMGAICGRRDIMENLNTSQMSRTLRCYVGGGTFSANPASMAAGLATLDALKKNPTIYVEINKMGDTLRSRIGRILDGVATITGSGSLFMTHFLRDGISDINNASQAAMCDQDALRLYHMHLLGHENIFLLPCKMGSISAAHTAVDMQRMSNATEQFVAATANR